MSEVNFGALGALVLDAGTRVAKPGGVLRFVIGQSGVLAVAGLAGESSGPDF